LIAKFQIEQIITNNEKVYVLAKHINIDINFFLADNSYFGPAPIEKWMDIPRAHDAEGNLRSNLYAFVLKHSADKDKLKTGEVFSLWDDYVEVVESFKFSNGKIIAMLQCYPGKLDGSLELSDTSGRRWILKCEIKATGSYEAYEKDEDNAKKNIFQYLLEPIDHAGKPLKDDKLKIIKKETPGNHTYE
jgi:hypothetical protein